MTDPPAIEMTTRSLPGRGLEYVRPAAEPACLEVLCDCGTLTILHIDPAEAEAVIEAAGQPVETAFTCEGCHSVHWLTFTPREVRP